MSIPRRNLFLFQGVLRRYDTPYPHRYTGRSAIQKARNDRKINDTVYYDYFLFLIISYPPTFHDLDSAPFFLKRIPARRILVPRNTKKNPMR